MNNTPDDIIRYNKERWEEISAANVEDAQPWLDLDGDEAHRRVDPEGHVRSFEGMDVLCLAASGGQQSVAFALTGARVTVFDLSETQLAKDRDTARRYGVSVTTIQGDMQDTSSLNAASFDHVWLAHAITFVPDLAAVIRGIRRVLRPGGTTRIHFTNPYVHGAWDRSYEDGYLLRGFYEDGAAVTERGETWDFADADGREHVVEGPVEFRHSVERVINLCISEGLTITGFYEEVGTDPDPPPGSFEHFTRVAPPWLVVRAALKG